MSRVISTLSELLAGTPSRAHFPMFGGTAWTTHQGLHDVRAYGGTDAGDGTTDDLAAFRLAVAAAAEAKTARGVGIVYAPPPPEVYLFDDYDDTSFPNDDGPFTLRQQLVVGGDGIVLVGDGPQSVIRSTRTNARPITFLGHAKGRAGTAWGDYDAADATVYACATIAHGAVEVTLTTPADAANFAVGDAVLIRTGQTIAALTRQPDAELNEVASVVGPVIGLRWPTTKPYAQEYYVTGTTGKTSTSVTANPAPFGLANVEDRVIRDVGVRDLTVECPSGTLQALTPWQVIGFEMDHVRLVHNALGLGSKSVRFADVSRSRFEGVQAAGVDSDHYWLSPSTGCTDWDVSHNRFVARGTASYEPHEGTARIRFAHNDLSLAMIGPFTHSVGIDVRARAYDHDISHNTVLFQTDTDASVVFIDSDCGGGGILSHNLLRGIGGLASARIDALNWDGLGDNTLVNGNLTSGFALGTATHTRTEVISGVVAHDGTTRSLGTVPAYAVPLRVWVEVREAFNSSGTDLLEIGYTSDHDAYATAIDVSTTGVKSVTLGAGAKYTGVTPQLAQAYYTPGGTAPTTGIVQVVIEFARVARRD